MRSFITSAIIALAALPMVLSVPVAQGGGRRPPGPPARPPARPPTRPPGRPTAAPGRPTVAPPRPPTVPGRPSSATRPRPTQPGRPTRPGAPPVTRPGRPTTGRPTSTGGASSGSPSITSGAPASSSAPPSTTSNAPPATSSAPSAGPPAGGGECAVSIDKVIVPEGQTKVVPDRSLKVNFVGLGVGTQNYTCNAEGKFASAGAVAELFDASCSQDFSTLADSGSTAGLKKLGDHFFRPKAGGGIEPVFTFTSAPGSPFVVSAKKDGVASPLGSANAVDLLQLNKVEGTMGTQLFRLETRGGVAPASCTGTETAQVPYTALYWVLDP